MQTLQQAFTSLPSPAAARRVALRLKPKGVRAMRAGHPWIFEDSIERVSHDGSPGDIAVAFDSDGGFLAAGIYDPGSTVRAKMLTHGAQKKIDLDFFKAQVNLALARRNKKLPPDTDAFRLVNGESDGFPGLVADIYSDAISIKAYSAAWLPWLGAFGQAASSAIPSLSRCAIRLSRELQRQQAEFKDGDTLPMDAQWNGILTFKECGITFEADLMRGQKTGFFLDQRENRAMLASMSDGRTVLNLFSYSGGFSLHAADGGAKEVWSVDQDKHAIAAAERNFKLNGQRHNIARCKHRGLPEDVFEALTHLRSEGRLFDIVVVDPPSFAKSAVEVPNAVNAYSRLTKAALQVLKPGGTLVSASCSSRVDAEIFFGIVNKAAAESGRTLSEICRTSHALDHPAKFKESAYLKCLFAKA